ncbi:MAG: glycosyltransferase [bacterium]|nr:glycosyltransferase [bacterium]
MFQKISGLDPVKIKQLVFSAIAYIFVLLFAVWWFNPVHIPHNFSGNAQILDIILYLLVSYVIWHAIIMEVLTWLISSHIKEIPPQEPLVGMKIAFITTIVPKSEPLSLLHRCLPAMVKADYPHDTWILDESDSDEVKEICGQYGVNHFSRFGNDEYNTLYGKFAKKTKGGNHNSWYDAYGDNYDIVAQIDTDFVPKSTFLTKTLGYFRDPKIAFVGTPQIYGNISNSLIARGAAEQQYSFYGSVLRGLSGMGSTLLIGANHVIRVAALRSVDHYSAHITEDLLTGMKLHNQGWKSIYVPDMLAVGEGPLTWEAYLNQQMRWAYGCIDILFNHSPNLFRKMKLRRTIYYFFLQQHYFSGIAMALSVVLLTVYFAFGLRAADIDIIKFFLFYSGILLICWLMSVWLQHYQVHQEDESELQLAGKIINVAAWPIWFLAFISVMLGKRLTYIVTPKGVNDKQGSKLPAVFIPHLVLGAVSIVGLVSSLITHHQNIAMVFWGLCSAFLMLCVPFSENIVNVFARIRAKTKQLINKVYNRDRDAAKSEKNFLGHTSLEIVNDSIFLAFVVTTSFILYVRKLGFYSDDWSFLGNFRLSADQSLLGLFRIATTPNTFMRPVQNAYDTLLYWFFGLQPFGYHVVNGVVLVGIALFIYYVLRQLQFPRIVAISLALVYILIPNYSTNRFWYASFQANLSMLLYLVSLFTGLIAVGIKNRPALRWKIASILSLILSALSYEVILPLYLLNIVLFLNPFELFCQTSSESNRPKKRNLVFIVVTFISLLYVFAFKALTTTRLGSVAGHDILYYPTNILTVLTSAFQLNYIDFGIKAPYVLVFMLSHYTNIFIVIYGVVVGITIFLYLLFISSSRKTDLPGVKWMGTLTLASLLVFALGYSIFFINENITSSSVGSANRVAFAASLGIALSIVGANGWVTRSFFTLRTAKVFFSFVIAVTCTAGFIIINSLATFWIVAYEQQQVILSDIQKTIPVMPSGTTLILDGVCPYVGPASVFEAHWDLKGALQIMYNDATLRADIVTTRFEVTDEGFKTTTYSISEQYNYLKDQIYIYNFKTKEIIPIADSVDADQYFHTIYSDTRYSCPAGSEGKGANIFE